MGVVRCVFLMYYTDDAVISMREEESVAGLCLLSYAVCTSAVKLIVHTAIENVRIFL